MKVFINAILELFILLIAVVIVLLGAKILKIENPYTDYEKTHPNSVVTVGMACQLIPEGTEITHEKTAEMLNYVLFRKDKWDVPEWFTAFLNRKVSISAAKVYCLYFPVGFVAAFLCLLLGVGFPFSILKRHSMSRLFHEALVNENRVYIDFYGNVLGHPGETRAMFLTIIAWIVMLMIMFVYGCVFPFIIMFNFVVGIFLVIVYLLVLSAGNNLSKITRKCGIKKSGVEKYGIIEKHALYMVAGDINSNHLLYFKEYYNAVIAERILECDQETRMYDYNDAIDTIQYGNHELYKKHLIRCTIQQLKNVLSKRARKAACQIDKDVDKCDYIFAKIASNDYGTKYIIKSNNNDYYTIYNKPENFLLMRQLLSYDSKGEQFDTKDWNSWANRSVDDKLAVLQRLKFIEVPDEN